MSLDKDTASVGGSLGEDFNNLIPETTGADQNDRPHLTGSGIRFSLTSDIDFTGIISGVDGEIFLIFNASTNKEKLKFKHDDGASSIGNRIFCPDDGDFTLHSNSSAYIRYDSLLDGGNGGWHLVASKH